MSQLPRTRIFRVELPLDRAIPVKGLDSASRLILRVGHKVENGSWLWADCSPLPGFHAENLEECLAAAIGYFTSSRNFSLPPALHSPDFRSLPISLRTTLEILNWQRDLPKAKRYGDVFENAALLRVPPRAEFIQVIEDVREARVCKVKVGPGDKALAREFLEGLSAARSDRELRIDCNQAGGPEDGHDLENLIRGLPVAYVEEPTADLQALRILCKSLPIALDESLGLDSELDGLASAWVIKPNHLGWQETLRRFADQGPQTKVLSNVFESLETLRLYAWAYRHSVRQPVACGLGTAFYMAGDFEELDWNCKTFRGPWPASAIDLRISTLKGELVWEG